LHFQVFSRRGKPAALVLTRTSLCSGLRPGLRPSVFGLLPRLKTSAFNRSATSPANCLCGSAADEGAPEYRICSKHTSPDSRHMRSPTRSGYSCRCDRRLRYN
jgi:hypothetical protein